MCWTGSSSTPRVERLAKNSCNDTSHSINFLTALAKALYNVRSHREDLHKWFYLDYGSEENVLRLELFPSFMTVMVFKDLFNENGEMILKDHGFRIYYVNIDPTRSATSASIEPISEYNRPPEFDRTGKKLSPEEAMTLILNGKLKGQRKNEYRREGPGKRTPGKRTSEKREVGLKKPDLWVDFDVITRPSQKNEFRELSREFASTRRSSPKTPWISQRAST